MSALLRLFLRQGALLLVVALAVFALLKAAPLDPVAAHAGAAGLARLSEEARAALESAWGLNQPLSAQFLAWAERFLQGDPGFSFSQNRPVAEVLAERLGPSLLLTGLAWALSGLIGIALGVLAARAPGSLSDRAIRLFCWVLAASPTFWLGLLLLMLFSVTLGWTPVCCAAPIGSDPAEAGWWLRAQHLALPLLALSLFGVAQIALPVRSRMLEVTGADFLLQARAQGASEWSVLRHHALPHALRPGLVVLMASSGEILSGSILAEQVFAWPGLGRALIEAGLQGDVALLMALALLTALLVSAANLLADLLDRPAGAAR